MVLGSHLYCLENGDEISKSEYFIQAQFYIIKICSKDYKTHDREVTILYISCSITSHVQIPHIYNVSATIIYMHF